MTNPISHHFFRCAVAALGLALAAATQGCSLLGELRFEPLYSRARLDSTYTGRAKVNPNLSLLKFGHRRDDTGIAAASWVAGVDQAQLIEDVTSVTRRDPVFDQGALRENTGDVPTMLASTFLLQGLCGDPELFAAGTGALCAQVLRCRHRLFLETQPGEGQALQLVNCNFDPPCNGLRAP